jgi:hypothetical protein
MSVPGCTPARHRRPTAPGSAGARPGFPGPARRSVRTCLPPLGWLQLGGLPRRTAGRRGAIASTPVCALARRTAPGPPPRTGPGRRQDRPERQPAHRRPTRHGTAPLVSGIINGAAVHDERPCPGAVATARNPGAWPRGFSWRTGRDSNPRTSCPVTRFPSARIRPLCHLSRCVVEGADPGGLDVGATADAGAALSGRTASFAEEKWGPRRDSNPRPQESQSCALTS